MQHAHIQLQLQVRWHNSQYIHTTLLHIHVTWRYIITITADIFLITRHITDIQYRYRQNIAYSIHTDTRIDALTANTCHCHNFGIFCRTISNNTQQNMVTNMNLSQSESDLVLNRLRL